MKFTPCHVPGPDDKPPRRGSPFAAPDILERWPSGRRHRTRNAASGAIRFGGSNPFLSAKDRESLHQACLNADFFGLLQSPAAGGQGCGARSAANPREKGIRFPSNPRPHGRPQGVMPTSLSLRLVPLPVASLPSAGTALMRLRFAQNKPRRERDSVIPSSAGRRLPSSEMVR